MADAKITLTTEAKNDGLEKLNKALAEGQQSVVAMTKELKDLEKATRNGTQATKEQADAMVSLRKSINEQKAANKAYAREIGATTSEIKNSVKAMADGDKGARALAGSFRVTEGFTTAFSTAIGVLAGNIATGALSALTEMAGQIATLGAQMQQHVSQLAAMTGSTQLALEAQRALNDVYRNTNYQEDAVMNMGTQLMRMGYSAQNAASLIQLCADAAAGLGTGQQGAQQLVEAISRIQAAGELTSRQIVGLKMAGVDMDAAFKSLNMTGEQAMKAIEDGTLDSQRAIQALIDYLHQYDGKMAESKNNTIDAWGDVQGNLATTFAEIGKSIFDAFNQSGIVQELIDFTQSLVDMVRSDATGAFTDLKAIAGEVLDFIGGLLGFVLDTIKLIIVILHDAYAAFKSFGAQVVDAIRPAVDVVLALYDAVKAVMSSIGKNFGSKVGKSFRATFDSGLEPEERAERRRAARQNNFRQRSFGGSSGGGGARSRSGGGGGASKAMSEEQRAIDALIKKYADADKSARNLAKAQIELAKVNIGMMSNEQKVIAEKQMKLDSLKLSHDELIKGYEKELVTAAKISSESTRTSVINGINAQIDAENRLYQAKQKQIEYEDAIKQRKLDTAAYEQEMQHVQNLMDMNMISAEQRIAMENSVLESRKQQLQTMLEDATLYAEQRAEIERQLAETIKQLNQNAAYDVSSGWKQALQELANQQVNFKETFTSAFGSIENGLVNLVSGTESAKEKFKKFCQDITKTILQSMAQIIIRGLITKAIMGAIGFGGGGSLFQGSSGFNWGANALTTSRLFANGGRVSGPGTGTSDSIPAMLSNGEYVIRSKAVDRVGVGILNAINSGRHFASGGYVGGGPAGVSGAPPVVINLHNESGVAMDAQQTDSTFDGEKWVIGVVMNGIANNTMGMRSMIKGGMA